ncbi:Blp family class II bacteriocin [Staphylococcus epidermidis]|jgi:hypothetical protein|uniref:Blp family class II bacteriocin n=1 Tax=Staphylococcus TaxID=1279 RepID=UPI00026BF23F|nr:MULTISPECIES: Blp family class II bacteriocin [Staphylococcus]MDU7773057.1 Blp family class II bacteriocin [Enterococcus faecalis]MDU7884744.1 Blp family class II bacteriocin [Klebsiella michiganensis]HEQ3959462.1 Blp family class II bacteriocin [Streptococcus pyogenes]EJE17387.1 hypothetical protein HMPREF9979_01470 [Staphylococcus epidermidis NIHLM018]MCG2295683.1 Blp family class II bacteriocin [Staphylococcus epidermidis]
MKKIDNKNELMKINGGKKNKTKCYLTEGGETVAGGLAGLGTAGPAGMVIGGAAGAAHALGTNPNC